MTDRCLHGLGPRVDDTNDMSGAVRLCYHHTCKIAKEACTLVGSLGAIDMQYT